MLIKNNSYFTKYFDIKNQIYVLPNKKEWVDIKFTETTLDNHKYNSRAMSQRPDNYRCIINDLLPIPARSSWKVTENGLIEVKQNLINTNIDYSIKDLMRNSKKLLDVLDGEIAIELSGGLDTAIIIGIVKTLGIKVKLIGAISERYEFRTERYVQELLSKEHEDVEFVSELDTLPFSNLTSTPFHAIPNKSSLFYYLNSVTANWAQSKNIKYILNGIGCDTILIDSIQNKSNNYIFDKTNLDDGWANDYIFLPQSSMYVNVAANYSIRKIILSMRAMETLDTKKIWARKVFTDFIPEELSKYQYKASFGATYAEGLKRNRNEIMLVCKKAFEHCKLERINPNEMRKLIMCVEDSDQKAEFEFLARLSFANWIHAMIK